MNVNLLSKNQQGINKSKKTNISEISGPISAVGPPMSHYRNASGGSGSGKRILEAEKTGQKKVVPGPGVAVASG